MLVRQQKMQLSITPPAISQRLGGTCLKELESLQLLRADRFEISVYGNLYKKHVISIPKLHGMEEAVPILPLLIVTSF